MASFRTLESLSGSELTGKKILIRVDFNLPQDEKTHEVTDDSRIVKTLPTLEFLLRSGASLVLISHMGRPKGAPDATYSLEKVLPVLQKNLPGIPCAFVPDCVGAERDKAVAVLAPGHVLLLENLRFHPGETEKDESERKKFATLLTKGMDLFVNDAFGAAHRAHASIMECASILPSYAGRLLQKEIEMLDLVLQRPARPFVAIIGGSKVSSKIKVLETLLPKVDAILIGGAMAYTFLKSKLVETGNSMVERDYLPQAFSILNKAGFLEKGFYLPEDHIVSDQFHEKGKIRKAALEIPEGYMGMDIGPKTIARYAGIIKKARTVLWNGPMGVFEMEKFSRGTMEIARAMTKVKGTTIVGGGDSVYAVKLAKAEKFMTHVSTGGGATLEYLEGTPLPGVDVLRNS